MAPASKNFDFSKIGFFSCAKAEVQQCNRILHHLNRVHSQQPVTTPQHYRGCCGFSNYISEYSIWGLHLEVVVVTVGVVEAASAVVIAVAAAEAEVVVASEVVTEVSCARK